MSFLCIYLVCIFLKYTHLTFNRDNNQVMLFALNLHFPCSFPNAVLSALIIDKKKSISGLSSLQNVFFKTTTTTQLLRTGCFYVLHNQLCKREKLC